MCSPLPSAFSLPPPPPPVLAAEAGLLFSCEVLELLQAGGRTFLLATEIGGIQGACVSAVEVKLPDGALRFVHPSGAKASPEQHLCTARYCLQLIPLATGERGTGKPDAKRDL